MQLHVAALATSSHVVLVIHLQTIREAPASVQCMMRCTENYWFRFDNNQLWSVGGVALIKAQRFIITGQET